MNDTYTFDYNGVVVRTLINQDGEPLFILKDLGKALHHVKQAENDNYQNVKNSYKSKYFTMDTHELETLLISLSNVYRFTMESWFPESDAFKDWLSKVVLPAIYMESGYDGSEQEFKEKIMHIAHVKLTNTMNQNGNVPLTIDEYLFLCKGIEVIG